MSVSASPSAPGARPLQSGTVVGSGNSVAGHGEGAGVAAGGACWAIRNPDPARAVPTRAPAVICRHARVMSEPPRLYYPRVLALTIRGVLHADSIHSSPLSLGPDRRRRNRWRRARPIGRTDAGAR